MNLAGKRGSCIEPDAPARSGTGAPRITMILNGRAPDVTFLTCASDWIESGIESSH